MYEDIWISLISGGSYLVAWLDYRVNSIVDYDWEP